TNEFRLIVSGVDDAANSTAKTLYVSPAARTMDSSAVPPPLMPTRLPPLSYAYRSTSVPAGTSAAYVLTRANAVPAGTVTVIFLAPALSAGADELKVASVPVNVAGFNVAAAKPETAALSVPV